jgi:hypothetical protein
MEKLKMTTKAKPHEIRLGAIKAAIWKNQNESGIRHSVTFSRLYKEDGEWKRTENFGRDDLLLLAKVSDLAHSYIVEQSTSKEEAPE